ncbi:hypothetical protein FNAPI_3586 [Fusarium napiforme]|uniref:Uncharacterized protein n=1 Tax=Fusarium napiforme TaxID=42672 RepID=A0A8H5ND16_9HYPO|nr:hypothetical protein FNAPI_3586 [Fusarium napiforme]
MKPSLLFFPRLSISPIRRDQSCPSSIITDPGPASAHVGQVRTRQTASKQAQQQLQDPTAQLTDDVLDLLLQYITRTSRTPDAKALDPLYVQADNNQESRQPPVCFTRIYESGEVIYIPHHHQSRTLYGALPCYARSRLALSTITVFITDATRVVFRAVLRACFMFIPSSFLAW